MNNKIFHVTTTPRKSREFTVVLAVTLQAHVTINEFLYDRIFVRET